MEKQTIHNNNKNLIRTFVIIRTFSGYSNTITITIDEIQHKSFIESGKLRESLLQRPAREMILTRTTTTNLLLIIFPSLISSLSKQQLEMNDKSTEVFKPMKTFCWPDTFYLCKTYRYFKENALIQSMYLFIYDELFILIL